jgi:hypothetical protein
MPAGDRLSAVYAAVPDGLAAPWQKGGRYRFDRDLLRSLINVQVASGSAMISATGGLAAAVDVWIASELRRAAINPDRVWPRPQAPRTMPRSISSALGQFRFSRNAAERAIQQATLDQLVSRIGSGRSNILGGFFTKEIDVVMAEYDRGLELGVSTKTMTGSFGKNLGNRFEEASGDLLNIRRRYPLATFGYVYLVTANVFEEPASWERVKDMLRKLTSLGTGDDSASYDACALIVVDWTDGSAVLSEDGVPDDLSPDRFFEVMLRRLFSRSPVSDHVDARKLYLASGPEA